MDLGADILQESHLTETNTVETVAETEAPKYERHISGDYPTEGAAIILAMAAVVGVAYICTHTKEIYQKAVAYKNKIKRDFIDQMRV